jgi:hypothetical protein
VLLNRPRRAAARQLIPASLDRRRLTMPFTLGPCPRSDLP